MYNNSREYIKKVKEGLNPKKPKKLKEKDLFYTDSSNDRPYKNHIKDINNSKRIKNTIKKNTIKKNKK